MEYGDIIPLTIAVCKKHSFVIDNPAEHDALFQGYSCEDNNIVNVPTDPGIYVCKASYLNPGFVIVKAGKIY